jgi:predicted MFS family arabinose efflux permease
VSRLTRPPAPVLKFYLYQASISFGFFTPIFTLFLLHRGLDYTQIAALSSIYAALTVVGEIPTGYVGDRIGRRDSLLVSSAFMTLSLLGFLVARSFLALAVLYVLWTLSLVFRSGSADAWLYDALAADADVDETDFARVRGRGAAVNRGVTVLTMLAGGVLYSVRPTLPFLASAVLNGGSVAVLLTLPRNPQYTEQADDDALTVFDAVPVIRRHLTRPPLRSFVLYVALFFGTVAAIDTYVQPIATRTLGLPVSTMGPLYAGFTLASAVAGYAAGDVQRRLGVRGATLSVPVLVGVSLLLPLAAPAFAFPMFFLLRGSRTLLQPIVTQYLNDHAESAGRATILSAASMVYALVRLPLYLAGGVVADRFSPVVAVAALGAVLLLGLGAAATWEDPVVARSETGRTAE